MQKFKKKITCTPIVKPWPFMEFIQLAECSWEERLTLQVVHLLLPEVLVTALFFFYWSTADLQYFISFRYTTVIFLYTTHQSYSNVFDYFPVLYTTSLWLRTGSLYFLIPLTYSSHPLPPPAQSPSFSMIFLKCWKEKKFFQPRILYLFRLSFRIEGGRESSQTSKN